MFEFFTQHVHGGLFFARPVRKQLSACLFVYALLSQGLFQAQGAVFTAFAVDIGFCIA